METVRVAAEGIGPGGHEATSADLMAKAAISIEEDQEEERKKTREGVPWWVYGIGLLFCISFIVMMMILPQRVALLTGGIIIYSLAAIINFYAWIRVMIIAFTEGVGYGLMVLLLGCCGFWTYCFMRWDQCGGYFLMWLATNVVANLVGYTLEVQFGGEEDLGVRPPPAAVAQAGFDWQPPPLVRTSIA